MGGEHVNAKGAQMNDTFNWVASGSHPGLLMREAFQYFLYEMKHENETRSRRVQLAKEKFSPVQLSEFRQICEEVEAKAMADPNPLIPLRRAIMLEVDSYAREQALLALPANERQQLFDRLNEKGSQFSDVISAGLSLHSEIICGVLRYYSSLKYGDGAENDWFTFYTRAAELKAKAMIKMFQGSGTDAVLYKAWHDSTPQLQEFVLSRMLVSRLTMIK